MVAECINDAANCILILKIKLIQHRLITAANRHYRCLCASKYIVPTSELQKAFNLLPGKVFKVCKPSSNVVKLGFPN